MRLCYKFFLSIISILSFSSCNRPIPASEIVSITDFVDGVAVIEHVDGYFLFVDSDLKPINKDRKYSRFDGFVGDFAVVVWESVFSENHPQEIKACVVNRKGEELYESEEYFPSSIFPDGKIWIKGLGERLALVDLNNQRVIFEDFGTLYSIASNGNSVLMRERRDKNPKWGMFFNHLIEFLMVSSNGEIILPWGSMGYIAPFANGMAVASVSSQTGNRPQGEHLIVRTVKNNITWYPDLGYINEDGEMVIKERFQEAGDFNDQGYARVNIHDEYDSQTSWKYIDRGGRILKGEEENAARRTFN